MSLKSLVSIIIPTYNRAHLIGETLDSVLAQTYINWECIVVDDGSVDGTDVLMKQYTESDARFQYHKRPHTHLSGGNGARNYGFKLSKGKYIQWFDSDDVMGDRYLEARLNLFSNQIKLVICAGYLTDEDLNIRKTIILNTNVNLYKEYALWRFEIYTKSALIKRTAMRGHDLFNETIKRGQETEFFTRLFFQLDFNEYKILNTPLFFYRQHSLTKTALSKNYNKTFKKNLVFIAKNNFHKALDLQDEELVRFYYILLVKEMFRSADHNHFSNIKEIIKVIIAALDNRNAVLKIKLLPIVSIYYLFKRGYGIRKHLLNHAIVYKTPE
ncbi:MAG: glycosyltransferase family 2 protein [Ferruginibacter sp.]